MNTAEGAYEKNRAYIGLIGIVMLALILLWWPKINWDKHEYVLDQTDPSLYVGSWKPALNGNVEYGIALRAIALRDSKSQRILWVLKADDYPDIYLSTAGFFDDLELHNNDLWFSMGDRTSISHIGIVNLKTKHLDHYPLPDSATILSYAINKELLWVVLSISQEDNYELVLYNLVTKEKILLDTKVFKNDSMMYTPWPNVMWVNTNTLEYVSSKGITEQYIVRP